MNLSKPLTLPCGINIKNRLAKSAMSENLATATHLPHLGFEKVYARWAQGGSGLLITGNVMVDSTAIGEPRNVVIERGFAGMPELTQWARAGTQNGAQLWMQINHPGKQIPKFINKTPVSPSAISFSAPMNKMFNPPRALLETEIWDIIERFTFTAETAKKAGFTGVQIHGAHGYLVSQFLSPLHNQRTDQWGGSLENRMRFVCEIYKLLRATLGKSFPISVKLNSADFQKGGFSEHESMQVVQTLAAQGIDLIEISGGTYEAPVMTGAARKTSTAQREAYFSDYCEKVRAVTKVPLMLTGGFRTSAGMESALSTHACDLIGLARSLALNPELPNALLSAQDCRSEVRPLTTGFKSLDKIFPLEITWYTRQIHKMGRGKNPNPNASVFMSVLETIGSAGFQGLKQLRAK